MSATIINLATRRGDDHPQWLTAPTYNALPFVTLKSEAERTGDYRDALTWWNDIPTDDQIATIDGDAITLRWQLMLYRQTDAVLAACSLRFGTFF